MCFLNELIMSNYLMFCAPGGFAKVKEGIHRLTGEKVRGVCAPMDVTAYLHTLSGCCEDHGQDNAWRKCGQVRCGGGVCRTCPSLSSMTCQGCTGRSGL